MKKVIALLCFVAMVITLVACAKKGDTIIDTPKSNNIADGEIVKLLLSPYGDEETVGLNAGARNYVSVTANGYFNPQSLKFVSDDEDIAVIKYDSTALENCIYYKIEGVSIGKTTVHIESADGKVKSEDIEVTVVRRIATTTQLNIEYKPYNYQADEYSIYMESTTEEETTENPTAEIITTEPTTIPPTEIPTWYTEPPTEPPTTRKPWWRW